MPAHLESGGTYVRIRGRFSVLTQGGLPEEIQRAGVSTCSAPWLLALEYRPEERHEKTCIDLIPEQRAVIICGAVVNT